MLLAVANDGSRHHIVVKGAVNRVIYDNFIRSLPYPRDTVILADNVAFHKNVDAIGCKGYECIYTPPYSPQFNPVEYTFSTIKHAFRRLWPWRENGVDFAIEEAIESTTSHNIISAFAHVENSVWRSGA